MTTPIKVLITGAAGQIGYALVFRIASGELIEGRPIILHLLEITPALPALEGVKMELIDCAFPYLEDVICTDKNEVAFKDIDVAFLVGAFPRKEGMDRSELLTKNGGIFTVQGKALSDFAKKTVKVLVVGNPANTNCYIALKSAPNLKPNNFSAMTRLDHNRAIGEIASQLKVLPDDVKNVIIWGNHSNTQVPDATSAEAIVEGKSVKVADKLDADYLQGEFVDKISKRGAAVIKARGASSAASAANAAIDHVRDWLNGTPEGTFVSMAIPAPKSNPYGIPENTVFSFPVKISTAGEVTIVKGLPVSDWLKGKLKTTQDELIGEKTAAETALNLASSSSSCCNLL